MADATDLHALAVALLGLSEDALDTIPGFAPGLEGAPERTFVSAGQPALDCCDQLSVNVATIREGNTEPGGLGAGTRRKQRFRVNHVGFNVYITRCLPDAALQTLPPATVYLDAQAEQTNADAWALWNYTWAESDALVSLCDGVFYDALTPLQPSGGCAGWLLSIRLQLRGYPVTF